MRKPWKTFSFTVNQSSNNDEDALNEQNTVIVTKKIQPLLNLESGEKVDNVEDTRNYVFIIFMIFGFGALMPWNMFLNIAYDYFTSFKFLESNNTVTWESTNFQNAMTISSQIPNLLFAIASIFSAAKGNLPRRMKFCLVVVLAMIVLTMGFIYINTEDWVTSFFILTLVTIIIQNAANGLFQNSLFGVASSFPFKYTNAILIGQNFCGILSTVLLIICKLISGDIQIRAMLFFGLSSSVVITCFVLLNFLPKLRFYQKYGVLTGEDSLDNVSDDSDDANEHWENIQTAFSKSKMQFANIFFLFFVTLAMFPNFTMYIHDSLPGEPHTFPISLEFYKDVTSFFNFNLFAFLGSLTANYVQVPGPKTIWIFVLVRFWFMFYFPFANYVPPGATRALPVLFESTWLFIVNVAVLAFSSGYLSSLIMMYAPRAHEDPKVQRTTGMIAAFFLIFGILGGLIVSWPLKNLVANVN